MNKIKFGRPRSRLAVAILAAIAFTSITSSAQAQEFASTINLSSLHGKSGFRILGAEANDKTGEALSAAGDINGDGLDDLIIGAKDAGPTGEFQAGASYVVFGKTGVFADLFNLSSLNGSNGFRIDGVISRHNSGTSVSAAGDINGDGLDDLIIGATGTDNFAGSSYVLFGSRSGFQATVGLINLDGSNGFRIDGANSADFAGFSVAGAGDINGDGIADLLVGSPAHNSGGANPQGKSYVVFGKTSAFPATLQLADLNGNNGFRLNGVSAGDIVGSSVSAAGDINGDGVDDLIMAPLGQAPTGTSFQALVTSCSARPALLRPQRIYRVSMAATVLEFWGKLRATILALLSVRRATSMAMD